MTNKILLLGLLFLMSGCKKFLDKKSNQALVVPSSINDLQAVMDNENVSFQQYSASLEAAADCYYMTSEAWEAIPYPEYRNFYVWASSGIFYFSSNDWTMLYTKVYNANVVIEGLSKLERRPGDENQWNDVYGQALMMRANSFFQLASLFSLAYDKSSSSADLGIPLRLNSDYNQKSVRASVEDSYQQILDDYRKAASLLPNNTFNVIRPTKTAANGMMARVFLSMREYDSAYLYADKALQVKSTLMNYNGGDGIADAGAEMSFVRQNPEVIYEIATYIPYQASLGYVDSLLYQSYANDDLRKTLFFQDFSLSLFKGDYSGSREFAFGGLATDELYFTHAECLARKGNSSEALNDLNRLLENRWRTGTYTPITEQDPAALLSIIIAERKKELLFRGLRWMDIKRMNKEGANITLTRNVGGQIYTLPPNDLRYAIAIPELVIERSGMPQNPR